MKKNLLLLLVILIHQLNVSAQTNNNWRALADGATYSWLSAATNANNVASLAYNPATDKLLVSSRNSNVYILNASTGAQEGTLSLVGLGSESFKFNKIRVTTDGVIYGISLVTGAGTCKIYRWANQTANPVECASFTVTERCGDSFGLSGTGTNTVLYASGAGTTSNAFSIYILNTADGNTFTVESKVTMTSSPTTNQQWANRVVEPVSTGVNSDIWIKGGGFNARRISISAPTAGVRTGTVVTTITDGLGAGQASIGYGGMRLNTLANGNKILAFAGGNNSEAGTVLRLLNVTNETSITTFGTASLRPTSEYATNANGSGDVAFKDMGGSVFQTFYLSTNNGIAATVNSDVLPVELTSFIASVKNNKNTLAWETASESNNFGFEIESSVDSKTFSKIGFVSAQNSGNSNSALTYSFEDRTANASTTYYRLKQVDRDGNFEYSDIKVITNPLLSGQSSFNIYPNPTTDYVVVNGANTTGTTVQLFNNIGVEVKGRLENDKLNLTGLNSGLYFVKVSKNGVLVQTTKLVKK